MILNKLLKIQTELKCNKGQWNDFGKYNYRSCEDILTAVKPYMAELNLSLYFSDTVEQVGNRNYIKTELTLVDLDDKDQIKVTGYAREEETKKGMDGSQITGASSSYARKYALNGLFAIDDGVDSDTTNKGDNTAKSSPQATKHQNATTNSPKTETSEKQANSGLKCEQCNKEVDDRVAKYSKDKFGKVLCYKCQKTPNKEVDTPTDAYYDYPF